MVIKALCMGPDTMKLLCNLFNLWFSFCYFVNAVHNLHVMYGVEMFWQNVSLSKQFEGFILWDNSAVPVNLYKMHGLVKLQPCFDQGTSASTFMFNRKQKQDKISTGSHTLVE